MAKKRTSRKRTTAPGKAAGTSPTARGASSTSGPRKTKRKGAKASKPPGTAGKPSGANKQTRKSHSKAAAAQRQIDLLDQQLLDLVEQRRTLVHGLGQYDDANASDRMAKAHAAIAALVNLRVDPEGPSQQDALPAQQAAELLRHVASLCLIDEHALRVAYLGPPYSYSHQATLKYFGDATETAPVASIAAVFESVVNKECQAGVVPIENSTDGRVVDTLGMFVRHRVRICGEVLCAIHHNLLSRTPREEITEVYSKPQALSQCRGWLASHLPSARLVELSSTAAAARLASEKPGVAAVASLEAARGYGLDVIDRNIEDNPNNVTRFAVLGRDQPAPTGQDKTALLFQVNHEPGALADAMTIFKRGKLNLTWIESFPLQGSTSEYLFFIEAEGHATDEKMAAAIAALQERALRLDILGSYPRGELIE